MKKIFIFFLLLSFQHTSFSAMEIPKTDAISSWLSSEERLPKKQTIGQNISISQKYPRPITELVRYVAAQKIEKKQAARQNPILPQKSPRTIAQLVQPAIIQQKNNICDQCNKSFVYKGDLNRHKNTVHANEKQYSCDQCDKSFTRKDNLTVHKNTFHVDEKPYSCDKCNKSFKLKNSLKVHKNTVHSNIRGYHCNKCEKTYKTQSVLDLHLAEYHSNIKYACSICDATFKCFDKLTRHENSVHATTRPHKCNHKGCHKDFKTKIELNHHIKRHSATRSYLCECGKSFITKSELTQHKICHSSKKSYLCEQCNKWFSYESTLATHQKKYCKEKPTIS